MVGGYVFFFKQKTAYEMRISDWSSDVCSSDLAGRSRLLGLDRRRHQRAHARDLTADVANLGRIVELPHLVLETGLEEILAQLLLVRGELSIGRASCRERVCQYG